MERPTATVVLSSRTLLGGLVNVSHLILQTHSITTPPVSAVKPVVRFQRRPLPGLGTHGGQDSSDTVDDSSAVGVVPPRSSSGEIAEQDIANRWASRNNDLPSVRLKLLQEQALNTENAQNTTLQYKRD